MKPSNFLPTSAFLASALLKGVSAQAPFGYAATASITGTAKQSQLSSSVYTYASSVALQPAYTSFVAECLQVQVQDAALSAFEAASCSPFELVAMLFTATATPAWYTQMPGDMQGYVSSLASAEQSIIHAVNPAPARATVAVGAALGALLGWVAML